MSNDNFKRQTWASYLALWVSQNRKAMECLKVYQTKAFTVDTKFYFSGTILGLKCNHDLMRHEFAPEARMFPFIRVDQRWSRPGLPTEIEGRLPQGQAVVIIAALVVLSWAILIAIIMVLREVL
jgi:hypothetical protein